MWESPYSGASKGKPLSSFDRSSPETVLKSMSPCSNEFSRSEDVPYGDIMLIDVFSDPERLVMLMGRGLNLVVSRSNCEILSEHAIHNLFWAESKYDAVISPSVGMVSTWVKVTIS